VSGALAERDFVKKLEKAGFIDIEVVNRVPFSIDDCALYPLFDDDLIQLMKETISPDKQHSVAMSVVVKAKFPFGGPVRSFEPSP
jgi:arsenite methyltransferase